MDNITEYTEEIQEMFLKFLVNDPELFVRVNNIVEPTACLIGSTKTQLSF